MKAKQSRNFNSKVVQDALLFLALFINKDQLDCMVEQLDAKYSKASSTMQGSVAKITSILKKNHKLRTCASTESTALKPSSSIETIKVSHLPPVVVHLPPSPVQPEPKEVPFKIVNPPKRGAAPSTERSLVLMDSSKSARAIARVPDFNVSLGKAAEHLASNQLNAFKKIPISKSLPYLKISTLKTPEGLTEKVIVLGTVSGKTTPTSEYQQIFCAVNEVVPSKKNTNHLFYNSKGDFCVVNSTNNVNGVPEERWVRILKYQDGLLFRYWRANKDKGMDEEKRFFRVAGTKVVELTSSDYYTIYNLQNPVVSPDL